MSAPKQPLEQFQTEWNKAVAWAQSNGISASAYMPVYQVDSARLNSGEQPMSAAERNRAILAANNPNDVTPVPSDKPNPSSVFGNARQDLGMIATGLEPQHLVANLFDTVVNTGKDLLNPKRLVGKDLDATAANVLQDTLLSFVPGAYDVGSVLRNGGNLDVLAEHPLVSLLDILPAGSSKLLTGALADSAVGARLADAGGFSSTDALRQSSLGHTLLALMKNKVPDGKFAKMGVDPNSAEAGIDNMSIGQRLQTWAGNSPLGTSGPIQKIASEYVLNNQMYTAVSHNILEPAVKAWAGLSDTEKQQYDEIFLRQSRGDDIQRLLQDPTIPLAVRDAAQKMIRGPLRFVTEEALAARDVTMLRRPDGSVAMYSSKQAETVFNAKGKLATARVEFTMGLDATDRLRTTVEGIDRALPKVVGTLDQANQAARRAIPDDESLLSNVMDASPGASPTAVLGTKRDMANRLFGNGGMVDAVVEQAKTSPDVDALSGMVGVLQSRLKRWGAYSVDASENPAFKAVSAQVDQLDRLAKQRTHLNGEIDRRINGSTTHAKYEVARQKTQLAQIHERQRDELAVSQQHERDQQRQGRQGAIAKAKSDLAVRLQEIDQTERLEEAEDIAIGDNAARRATKTQADAIYRQVKAKLDARHKIVLRQKAEETAKSDKAIAGINKTWDKASGSLAEKHATARSTMRQSHIMERANTGGELMQKMRDYTHALDDFHRAVYDNPSDEYRDMRSQIYEDKLLESDRAAEILDEKERQLIEHSSWDEGRLQALREDPQKLRELVAEMVEDVYKNPENFDPELVDAVTEAHDEAVKSAVTEINTLMAQGFRPMWLPASGPFERASFSIKSLIGKGVPHVDVAHARKNELVNTRYSVVLGATKAVAETIRRDATIDFVEDSVVPRTVTGTQLRAQLDQMGLLEPGGALAGWDPAEQTITAARSRELAKLGLTRVDPMTMFGYTMPRFEGEALYLPTGLSTALERMKDIERKGDTGIFDKTNKLFRMSILGLSPRYTAHILFGGTFLLALRSTPFMPSMLRTASKALREGSLPQEIFRTPTQEGVQHLSTALDQLHWAGGSQLANLVVQEDLSLVQKIAHGKASPIQILKSAADINYRFTHHVVRMQTAVAYLDYASRAERRGSFVDEVTGETVTMTKERAMHEGMAHVEEVFGNLRSMSPLERQLAKNIMPFYGWTRHILNYVMSFPSDHPWRAMVLSLMAFENSENVPKGLPERIQFLFFFGSPDSQGNVTAVDDRFMDPLRDIANYATIGGWLQGLNPALLAPLVIMNPQAVYGANSLYPNVSYDQFYGIETAGDQGNIVTGLQQFVPQLGALSAAFTAAGNYRAISKNPNAFYKSVFESLNIPFAQVQKINVKQIAAHDETARYQVAKQAAENAFDSGDFSLLKGYSSVPNPLNPDYDITPAQLAAVYNAAAQQYPGTAPVEVLTPPPTPIGY